jgi:branched-chain amino acid aminotransferase
VRLQIWVEQYRWNFPPESRDTGTKAIIPTVRAFPRQCLDPRLKSFNRLHFFLAQLEVVKAGVDGFIILTTDGHLSESYGSNVWLIKKGVLLTPSEDALGGITRECVFDLAEEMNIEARGALLSSWDLYTADEAFLSTSAGGIFPIIEVDSRPIGNGKRGQITKRLIDAYWKMHVDPKYWVQVYKNSSSRNME